ncbi:hypothetical protein ACFYWD_32905 [Streptomyces sp. NPDC003781]
MRAYGTGKLPIALADGRTFTLDPDPDPDPDPDKLLVPEPDTGTH